MRRGGRTNKILCPVKKGVYKENRLNKEKKKKESKGSKNRRKQF